MGQACRVGIWSPLPTLCNVDHLLDRGRLNPRLPDNRLCYCHHWHFRRSSPTRQTTLQLVGKREGRSSVAASGAGHNNGLLFLYDTVSKRPFVEDTGAEVGVLPATGLGTPTRQPGPSLVAANGSSITTCVKRTLSLHLACNTYQWDIAVTSRPSLPLGNVPHLSPFPVIWSKLMLGHWR